MKNLSVLLFTSAVSLAAPVQAADQDRDRVQTRDPSTHTTQSQDQEGPQVYGWELMNDKERKEYQDRMRSQKTEKDRAALRAEHHKKMQERAKAQGKTLPDMAPEQRGSSNPPWMGQGQGKGQGTGKP